MPHVSVLPWCIAVCLAVGGVSADRVRAEPRSGSSHLLERVAARPAIAQQSQDYQLEPSPLERLIPYLEREGGVGIEAPKLAQPVYDEAEERLRIGVEATHLFYYNESADDLSKLDALLERYRDARETTASGVSKLVVAYSRFRQRAEDIHPDETTQRRQLDKIDAWQAAHPNSISPKIIRAIALREYAFGMLNERGLVRQAKNLTVFRKRLAPLVDYLQSIKQDVASRDPYWHILMIEARAAQRASSAELFALLDEASKAFPDEVQIYVSAIVNMVPLSKQPIDDVETIAVLAAVRGNAQGKSAFYARTYWAAINMVFGAGAVPALKIDWQRFAEGAREVSARYPVQWNIQHFAALACFGRDAAVTSEFFKSIEGRPLRQAWGDIAVHDRCRDWAADPVNRYGKQHAPIEN